MDQNDLPEIKLDDANLYLEESFTDRRVGILRRLTPVTADGSPDTGRRPLFLGQTQLMTQVGALPISFEIDAADLAEALEKYAEAAKVGIERTMEELQEMRREAASSIVVPGQGGGLGGGGGFGGSGGGIQMP